ncbi:hypothetical protein L207DRAFT_529886 [Hyaloscypha variabilis F]|uniref:Uncharacterized protein n=1 Tax=Hyaloscypha variabilis (strain UAMH 11265 / GT02V1 / F) TaxID=1149755 RepID=A0A2J6RN82_HYAVF|nr:hypothetical protein L207DRAFT_529886 [Hyaloscypha variabilis F]
MSLLQIIPLTPSLHHLHRLGALIGSWAWGPSKAKGTANHMLAEHTAPPPLRFQRARLSHKPHLVTVKRRRTSVAEHCSGAERSSKLEAAPLLPMFLATCQDGYSNVLGWQQQSQLLCAVLETLELYRCVFASSLEHRLFCLAHLTLILEQPVGWNSPTPDPPWIKATQSHINAGRHPFAIATSWRETFLMDTPRLQEKHF